MQTKSAPGTAHVMKAVRVHAYGGPEVLKCEDAPRPLAGPGQLLIRVHAAGVNPVDWKLREGHPKEWRSSSRRCCRWRKRAAPAR